MKTSLKFSDVRLGLYQYIDNKTDHLGNTFNLSMFLEYDISLQAYFFNNDVKNTRDAVNKQSNKQIIEIERGTDFEFISIRAARPIAVLLSTPGDFTPDELKAKYYTEIYKFIYQKTDKSKKDSNEEYEDVMEDESGIGLSRKDEYEIVKNEQAGYIESEQLPVELNDTIAFKFKLSPLELACLKYLSDSEFDDFPLIKVFSYSGIIQMANKGAIKMYLNSLKGN